MTFPPSVALRPSHCSDFPAWAAATVESVGAREAIRAHYKQQVAKLAALGKIAPEQAAAATAALAEKADLRRLRSVIRQEDVKREASGYAEAQRQLSETSDADYFALLDVCAYRCSTLREIQIKADYLLPWSGPYYGSLDDPRMIVALVKSMADPNAPEHRAARPSA